MTTYETMGKAKKQCPNCSSFLHARVLKCENCKHEFGIRKTIIKDPEIFTEGGKGRKLCLNCNKYAGAKSKKCPNCNTEFLKKEKPTEKVETIVENIEPKPIIPVDKNIPKSYIGSLVFTPSGECPFVLKNKDKESIYDWCSKVFNYGLKLDKTYSKNALQYWYNVNNSTVKFSQYIDEWYEQKDSREDNFDDESNEVSQEWSNSSF